MAPKNPSDNDDGRNPKRRKTSDPSNGDEQQRQDSPLAGIPIPRKKLWNLLEEEHESWLDLRMAAATADPAEHQPPPMADPSPSVLLPLHRYQNEWLFWALNQERSHVRGGILADEMGMGKTIEIVALVLTAPSRRPTLVVCPPAALMHWKREIEKVTERGSVRLLVRHGRKRTSKADDFGNFDFVLTTYSRVRNDFRRRALPPKEKCQGCGKSSFELCLQNEQEKKCRPCGRVSSVVEVGELRGESVLHSFMWERIVLDEANCIRGRHSKTARAVFALQSKYKWALSGTPVRNWVGEFYSLVYFLRVYPYSFYFCKRCDCRMLDLGSKKSCAGCHHAPRVHFCWWNKYINRRLSKHDLVGKRAMVLLQDRILKRVMLRRTKDGRASDVSVPPKKVRLRQDSLGKDEEGFYNTMHNRSRIEFDKFVKDDKRHNFPELPNLLTHLPQAVEHPYLVGYSDIAEVFEVLNGNKEDGVLGVCGMCHDPADHTMVTSCGHVFCKGCLMNHSANFGKSSHPSCSKLLTTSNSGEKISPTVIENYKHSGILNKFSSKEFKMSTKTDAQVLLTEPCWNPTVERQAQDQVHRIGQYKLIKTVGKSCAAMDELTEEEY